MDKPKIADKKPIATDLGKENNICGAHVVNLKTNPFEIFRMYLLHLNRFHLK
jgi:hypothetical protein